jgi:hypothetical protein
VIRDEEGKPAFWDNLLATTIVIGFGYAVVLVILMGVAVPKLGISLLIISLVLIGLCWLILKRGREIDEEVEEE